MSNDGCSVGMKRIGRVVVVVVVVVSQACLKHVGESVRLGHECDRADGHDDDSWDYGVNPRNEKRLGLLRKRMTVAQFDLPAI